MIVDLLLENIPDITFLFLQPLLLFIFIAFIWSLQSFIILHFSMKHIHRNLRRNKITELVVAKVSVLIHELSHFITAIHTGSVIDLKRTFVTAEAGRVTARREESIFGWISNVIAASSPSFFPPILFIILFFVLTQSSPILDDFESISFIFRYYKTPSEIIAIFSEGISSFLVPNFILIISIIFDLTNPISFLLIYLIIVCSITAGPSEGDWQSTLKLFLSPVPAIALFFAFFLINILFAQFNIGFFIPLLLLVLFLFLIIILGNFFGFLLSTVISILISLGLKLLLFVLLIFLSVYYVLFHFIQSSLYRLLFPEKFIPFFIFLLAIFITWILALLVFIQKRQKKIKKDKKR